MGLFSARSIFSQRNSHVHLHNSVFDFCSLLLGMANIFLCFLSKQIDFFKYKNRNWKETNFLCKLMVIVKALAVKFIDVIRDLRFVCNG